MVGGGFPLGDEIEKLAVYGYSGHCVGFPLGFGRWDPEAHVGVFGELVHVGDVVPSEPFGFRVGACTVL